MKIEVPCHTGRGFSLLELIIGLGILAIAGGMVAMTLATTTIAIRETQAQALLAQKRQQAAKILDADIKQSSFLLAAQNGNIQPLWHDGETPVAAVTILDEGRRLRCVRIGEEFDGRVYQGVSPALPVNHATTELIVVGNVSQITTRIGPNRAFICVDPNGGGRFGRVFVTSAAPTAEPPPNQASRARVRGAFTTNPCLTVGTSAVPPPMYAGGEELAGMLFVPISALIEYRIEAEGLVRYEFAATENPCGGTSTASRKLLIERGLFSDITFDYLLKRGERTTSLTTTTFPDFRGIMMETRRRDFNRTEIAELATFVVNEGW